MALRVLLDTCVLFPMYLRDSLLRLAIADLYQPLWSAEILGELERALVREEAASADQAARIVELMRTNFRDSEVLDYEPLVDTMRCDEKDRHVLAAAVKAGAAVLVTENGTDFPVDSTEPYSVEVLTSDVFLLDLLDAAPRVVVRTLARQAERYKRDPKTLDGLLSALARAGARNFADEVRRLMS